MERGCEQIKRLLFILNKGKVKHKLQRGKENFV
jgi:hypothetical protein